MSLIASLPFRARPKPPWDDAAPIRAELFSADRMEQHAESLAGAQPVTQQPARVLPLRQRLDDNARVVLAGFRAAAAAAAEGEPLVPAAEWLLDNYHLVEEQIREVRRDLPPGYYRQLPKLATGPFAGYPRVFGLTWAYVAHTDSHLDLDVLRRFIRAYQTVQPLDIGELWAIPVTLRIVLIENLRRLAEQIAEGVAARVQGDALADRLLADGGVPDAASGLPADRALPVGLAAQLAKRLRDRDPRTTSAPGWLEDRLRRQGTTIDQVVLASQQRQGAANVTIRNVILSLKLLSQIDWAELFESVSLVDERFRWASDFGQMDFATRNLYRSAIEQMARRSPMTELNVADRALDAARAGRAGEAEADPGYYLIGSGRLAFERSIGFRPPPRMRLNRVGLRLGLGGYVAAVLLLTAAAVLGGVVLLAMQPVAAWWIALFTATVFLPATEMATSVVNRMLARANGPLVLPGLELLDGVPNACRTLVVVPTLLTSEADILEQVSDLEVHFLAGSPGDLCFALLADGVDAPTQTLPKDGPMLEAAQRAIDALNERHGPSRGGERFLLLYRRRLFNPGEGVWMGWERKRGKLHELNRLLRGADDTSFVPVMARPPAVPGGVRYVITLDGDTKLPRGAALKMIGKMAHPLNRPVFDAGAGRVVGGYGILQPRVTPPLPLGEGGSTFQRVFSAPGGIDPYSAAVSDVYQDLLGEGSFTGKGIYDVDAFEAALAGRVPENRLLSHDLFEGVFARAGLASDVEVIEEYPTRYDVAAKRQHRWTRGDWQLLPWVLGRRGGGRGGLPSAGRWKMLDNLRRSLLAPLMLAGLALAFLQAWPVCLEAALLVLGTVAVPVFLGPVLGIWPHRADLRWRNHLASVADDFRMAAAQLALLVAFLPDAAWRMADGVARTLVRMGVTKRHLLEWTTAAQASSAARPGVGGMYGFMAGGTALAVLVALVAALVQPDGAPVGLVFGLLWLAAPFIAARVSAPPRAAAERRLDSDDAQALRQVARRTWRFFETVVTPADHMLPPDNLQEDPKPVLARRTSPTNIGIYMLSAVAARDFGWAGTAETVERLEATFATLAKLPRYNGHLFNWYATADLRALDPPYISTVDSGNLAGHLVALANACEEWVNEPYLLDAAPGMRDALREAEAALAAAPEGEDRRRIAALFDTLRPLSEPAEVLRVAEMAAAQAKAMPGDAEELAFWTGALRRVAAEQVRDRAAPPGALAPRLHALAAQARTLALGMDFTFLLDPERELLSIGYSTAENRLDASCYDLLASESRLSSLFAIAKGDLPTRHWFRLGRPGTPLGRGSALLSWAGSMFEYLMPSLVMRAPSGSLLETTNRLVVQRQEAYGAGLGVPWGVSEAAYNARDVELTYQYTNFGVPGLGLKRGLADNLVISPYSSGLATMVDPRSALRNYRAMAGMGAASRFGFYESLDFTPVRLPEGAKVAVVRTSMAHHQGMTIVAIANALQDGRMRGRFHREPMIQACELLLQERMPRDVAARSRAADPPNAVAARPVAAAARRYVVSGQALAESGPVTHLLSNGRYSVMLTAAGAGYSRWQGMAVTRWFEDPTRDNQGSFIYLRDVQSGAVWSAASQPVGREAEHEEVVFVEDRAEFTRRDGPLLTTMEVLVSSEDDGEVRRISLRNSGRQAREIEVTSYLELALAPPATDAAHPAFAKMFVQTEHLPGSGGGAGALLATRRKRTPNEATIWAAHFATVEGTTIGEPQHETDRARFIGRGQRQAAPACLASGTPAGDAALSGTVGTVLDPVFALRYRLRIPPGTVARVAFWTVAAATREALLDLVDRNRDRNAFDRASTLAWTQGQVQLRHLGIDAAEAANFQRLAAPVLYVDPAFRAPSEAILRGMAPQATLWPQSISGDLPIMLLRIDDAEDIGVVRQALRAYEYWRLKRLALDLVILNDRGSSYVQDLQVAIETAVRMSQPVPSDGEAVQGKVYVLRADLVPAELRGLLRAVARVNLAARGGAIAEQLARLPPAPPQPRGTMRRGPRSQTARSRPMPRALEFFNGYGGFDRDGTEYVTVLDGMRLTPAPWINVIANDGFGFHVSAEGSGFTWAENSRENQITPWSCDPVMDPAGEALYIRDEMTGDLWTPTALPIRDPGTYVARHGFGYSRFEHRANGIASELLQYVPVDDPVKISRLVLRNLSPGRRRVSVTAYAEWVLGRQRAGSAPFLTTEMDAATGAMFARNLWGMAFPGRVAFADLRGRQTAWTADRAEFLGRNGGPTAPGALVRNVPLSGRAGAGFDPCSALQDVIEIEVGAEVEVVWVLGQARSAEAARALVAKYRAADLDAVLGAVSAQWRGLLGTVQVKTPDRGMDVLLNGWLLYQVIACRLWARAAFYQASGAYGFRDQLQDGMALAFALPSQTRRHLVASAGRQFPQGDVQHWWLPHSGQGVRTHISDDRVWLAYAAARYVETSGDEAVLDEVVPFLEGPQLKPEDHDAFFQPEHSDEAASLFEHCARGLDQCIALTGANGLPLMGGGDWNDGMNEVGAGGKGESVWVGWLFLRAVEMFAPFADTRDLPRAARWRAHAETVRRAIEEKAWDGEWYRRATFDDGTWLGSTASDECRIDSIVQTWSVLSGAGEPGRAQQAMASFEAHLVRQEDRLALLFEPPFDVTRHNPGYIKGYPPGLRENGGQYSHAAMWAIMAFARMGHGGKAAALFGLLNPVGHAGSEAQAERYKVEPYVVAADVYSVAPHAGRGGWTWYTGSAGWMYRAGVEGILGLNRVAGGVMVSPALPPGWPGFEARISIDGAVLEVVVEAGETEAATLDGAAVGRALVPLDGAGHHLHMVTVARE